MKPLHETSKKELRTEIRIFQCIAAVFALMALLEVGYLTYLKVQNAKMTTDLRNTQIELDYYQETFKERVGRVYDEYGHPKMIRIVSIDGGDSWLVTSQSREVKGQRYLSIAYPNVNPDSLEVVE